MKRSQIDVEFRHPRFAALVPVGEISVQTLEEDLWKHLDSLTAIGTFNNYRPPESSFNYSGKIHLEIVRFEVPEYDYEATRRVDVVDIPGYLLPIPTAVIKAEILFKSLDKSILQTLSWYQESVRNFGQKTLQSQMVHMLDAILNALLEDENLQEILSDYETREKRFRFLTRKMADSQISDVAVLERPVDALQLGRQLIAALGKALRERGPLSDEEREEFIQLLDAVKTNLQSSHFGEESENQQMQLRLRKALQIESILRANRNGELILPPNVEPRAATQFSQDLFHIIMSHWNSIIRYLKYEMTQYWLEEYPIYAAGLFYIKHKVTLDGEEILPHMTAHVRQEVLKHHIIDETAWTSIGSSIYDCNRLKEYSMDWSIDGILSQAFSHLVSNELPASVILACVSLEEAMTRALFHVDPDNYEEGGLGLKIKKIHGLIGADRVGYDRNKWISDWNLLNAGSKETGNGLIQIRRRVQHYKMNSEKRIPNRVDIAERILAAQRICKTLVKWDREMKKAQ